MVRWKGRELERSQRSCCLLHLGYSRWERRERNGVIHIFLQSWHELASNVLAMPGCASLDLAMTQITHFTVQDVHIVSTLPKWTTGMVHKFSDPSWNLLLDWIHGSF
jgi:hypothetical protein